MQIHSVIGDICYNLNSKILIEKGWLVKPKIIFIKDYITNDKLRSMEIEAKQRLINETPNYHNYYNKFIVNCKERNDKIKEIVDKYKDKKVLVLVKLIQHGEILEAMIPNSKYLHGSINKKDREEMFDKFKNGDLKVLIATISIFSEGLDLPFLQIIMNVSANRGDVKTIQVLGRVLRILEGKKNAQYFDFSDEMSFFKVASLARIKILRKEGHDVEVINLNDINVK